MMNVILSFHGVYRCVLLFIVLLLLIAGCRKELDHEPLSSFTLTSTTNLPFIDGLNPVLLNSNVVTTNTDTSFASFMAQVKLYLGTLENESAGFLGSLENTFGFPLWNSSIQGIDIGDSSYIFMVPLIDTWSNRTYSVMLVREVAANHYSINMYKRYDIEKLLSYPETGQEVEDINDLFKICDCEIFNNVLPDSVYQNPTNSATPRNELITISFTLPNDPWNFCQPGTHTKNLTLLAKCPFSGGGGGTVGGISGDINWGGSTGTGGGADPSNGSISGVGSPGGSGISCPTEFNLIDYFELYSVLSNFIWSYDLPYEVDDLINYVDVSCLSPSANFDQCFIEHLRCLGKKLAHEIGLDYNQTQFMNADPVHRFLPLELLLRKHGRDEASKLYAYFVIEMLMEDSEFKAIRFGEFYDLLQEDPDALVRDCIESNPNFDPAFWSELALFVPPSNVLARLDDLGEGWRLQPLQTPSGSPSLNFDYFSVVINQMPINPSTGVQWTHEELFNHIRKNINDFSGSTEFNPISTDDFILWQSSNPVPAVISIDIPGPDNGSVICAQYEICCWIFSTVKAPMLPGFDGYHPVSGNRQFGYKILSNGSMEIYIKGVDRFLFPAFGPNNSGIGSLLGYLMEKIAFYAADNLWEGFQMAIKSYVEQPSHQGSATIVNPSLLRPKINQQLIEILRSNNKIEYVPCGN
jgi:hypothetical protein